MFDENAFLHELQESIRTNRITLPSLPDVALKVRAAVESDSSSARDIADIVSIDAGISARLLQVANSPLYRGRVTIDSVQTAVSRLGVKMVRSLVVSLAIRGIFQPTTDTLDSCFRQKWEESVRVAGIARVLARLQPHLNAEQAMLAGLIHDIGALPIMVHAEIKEDLAHDETRLDLLMKRLSPTVGRQILEAWNFPSSLVAVTTHSSNFTYSGGSQADYVDLIIVARLQSEFDNSRPDQELRWENVQSFEKLGLSPDIEIIELEGAREEITDVSDMFMH